MKAPNSLGVYLPNILCFHLSCLILTGFVLLSLPGCGGGRAGTNAGNQRSFIFAAQFADGAPAAELQIIEDTLGVSAVTNENGTVIVDLSSEETPTFLLRFEEFEEVLTIEQQELVIEVLIQIDESGINILSVGGQEREATVGSKDILDPLGSGTEIDTKAESNDSKKKSKKENDGSGSIFDGSVQSPNDGEDIADSDPPPGTQGGGFRDEEKTNNQQEQSSGGDDGLAINRPPPQTGPPAGDSDDGGSAPEQDSSSAPNSSGGAGLF